MSHQLPYDRLINYYLIRDFYNLILSFFMSEHIYNFARGLNKYLMRRLIITVSRWRSQVSIRRRVFMIKAFSNREYDTRCSIKSKDKDI